MFDPTDPKYIEAVRRVSVEERRYYPERTSWLGKPIPENIGKTIRVRLARLIDVAARSPHRYETMCACEWFIKKVSIDILPTLNLSAQLKDDINQYIRVLNTFVRNFETRHGSVDPNIFNHLILAAGDGITPEKFIYGWTTDAWGDGWNGTYLFHTPRGRLVAFANTFLT